MMATPNKTLMEGYLEKRQRGRSKPNSDDLVFQKRYFVLCGENLEYYKDGKPGGLTSKQRGTFPIKNVRTIEAVIEAVSSSMFGKKYCVMIGDEEEMLYLSCKSLKERDDWMEAFMKAANIRGNEMLPNHHPGVYIRKKRQWSCCENPKIDGTGCTPSDKNNTKTNVPKSIESRGKCQHCSSSSDSDHMDGNEILWKDMSQLQTYALTVTNNIVALKFISDSKIALVLDDCSVHIFDIPSNAVVHKIGLTHTISSIDEWNGYLLIGSSLIHVVDTRNHSSQWHRTVVVDMEERDNIKNPSDYLGVFNKDTGEFVTAKVGQPRLKLWPKPSDFDAPISKFVSKDGINGQITGIYSSGNLYLVLYTSENATHIDTFQWNATERLILHSITLDGSMFAEEIAVANDGMPRMVTTDQVAKIRATTIKDGAYVFFYDHEHTRQHESRHRRKAFSARGSLKTEDKITCLANTCLHIGNNTFIVTGHKSGKVEIKDTKNQQPVHCLQEQVQGSVVAIACRRDKLIAAATVKGDLTIWSESKVLFGKRKLSMELVEIEKFSIYSPATFSRHSIITDMFSFTAHSKGGLFVNRPSYSLEIPPGAVKTGEPVLIQTGIIRLAGNDRFKIPKGYQLVSPVVWFCKDKHDDFLKPITIELQHCAQCTGDLIVLKAKCSNTSDIIFEFEPFELEEEANTNEDHYVSFKSTHFCLFCCGVKNISPRTVCVVPIERYYLGNYKEVIFCVCYNLATCLRAVKDQYKNDVHYYRRRSIIAGSLHGGGASIIFNCESQSAFLKSGSSVVTVESLSHSDDIQELHLAHVEKTYPPSVHYEINSQSQDIVTFTFTGLNAETYTYTVEAKIMCTPSSDVNVIAEVFPGSSHMNEFTYDGPDYRDFH